jgi:hypothetical protein
MRMQRAFGGRVGPGYFRDGDGFIKPIPQGILDELMLDRSGDIVPIPDLHAKRLAERGHMPLAPEERERRMRELKAGRPRR